MGMMRVAGALSLVALLWAGCGDGKGSGSLPKDLTARHFALLDQAWGPESPETLQRFLEVRKEMKDYYDRYREGIQQWALREASTTPTYGQTVLGLMAMRQRVDEVLPQHQLTFDDFQRLTFLVYGRWLRAVQEGPPPERRVLRILREMEIGVDRTLAQNPPANPKELSVLETRLASIRHQAKCIEPFGRMDKLKTLDRLDPDTKIWLEAHRQEVEELSFGFFDTAAPPREEEKGPPKR